MFIFGDWLVLIMVIIVMCKIVKMKEEEKLKVVEVILKNVYVDDICDLVKNVEEVRVLIKEVDEIFEMGGFYVK